MGRDIHTLSISVLLAPALALARILFGAVLKENRQCTCMSNKLNQIRARAGARARRTLMDRVCMSTYPVLRKVSL